MSTVFKKPSEIRSTKERQCVKAEIRRSLTQARLEIPARSPQTPRGRTSAAQAAPRTPAAVCRDFSAELLASSGKSLDQSRRLEFFSESTKIQSRSKPGLQHTRNRSRHNPRRRTIYRNLQTAPLHHRHNLEFCPLGRPRPADIIPGLATHRIRTPVFFLTTGASRQAKALSPRNYLIERLQSRTARKHKNAILSCSLFPRRAFFAT